MTVPKFGKTRKCTDEVAAARQKRLLWTPHRLVVETDTRFLQNLACMGCTRRVRKRRRMFVSFATQINGVHILCEECMPKKPLTSQEARL